MNIFDAIIILERNKRVDSALDVSLQGSSNLCEDGEFAKVVELMTLALQYEDKVSHHTFLGILTGTRPWKQNPEIQPSRDELKKMIIRKIQKLEKVESEILDLIDWVNRL
jgi:hypothetical protein